MQMTGPAHMTGPMWMPSSPPDLARLAAWHPQPVPVFPTVCLLALIAYGAGVRRLHSRGDGWPLGRSLAFCLGLLSVLLMTATGIGGYGMQLLSVHMVQHMVLSMLSPILLLMGAPVTLALRTLPGGRHGLRGMLLAVLHSRFARVISSPFFTLPLFIVSLYGLYFTSIFDAAMSNWWGHNLMLAHFVGVGLLFFWPILAIDPSPRRTGHGLRILELLAGMPFHAFFGITVMMSSSLIVKFFADPPASWGLSALSDQKTAGGIAWGFSEIPTALVLFVLSAAWARSSDREARRSDRDADRSGDRELVAYNSMLASLAER
jgi:putative membrane protein